MAHAQNLYKMLIKVSFSKSLNHTVSDNTVSNKNAPQCVKGMKTAEQTDL